jgi:hypothetical protein
MVAHAYAPSRCGSSDFRTGAGGRRRSTCSEKGCQNGRCAAGRAVQRPF